MHDLRCSHLIKDGKVANKKLEKRQGKSKTCNTTRSALCCMQTGFNIYHTITCKSQSIIYLLECILCNLQYVGKSETRLNNHRKDVSNPKAIPVCLYFRKEGHNFIQHAKFTLIEQLTDTDNVSKATLKLRLKLDTFSLKGINQELNNAKSPTAAFTVHILLFYCS